MKTEIQTDNRITITRSSEAISNKGADLRGEVRVAWVPCHIPDAAGWYVTGKAIGLLPNWRTIHVWPQDVGAHEGYIGTDIVAALSAADTALEEMLTQASRIADGIMDGSID